jgi:hypothetical protein
LKTLSAIGFDSTGTGFGDGFETGTPGSPLRSRIPRGNGSSGFGRTACTRDGVSYSPHMHALKVLIPEDSSLSAREAVAALGKPGYVIDVLDPNPLCLYRFSRFVRRIYRSPRLSDDPNSFADFLLAHLSTHSYDLVLAVHEHSFPLSAIAGEIRKHCPVTVAPFDVFERLQNKVRLFDLLDTLRLPHPPTQNIATLAEIPLAKPMPYSVKTAFGTASDGTWRVSTAAERSTAPEALRAREQTGNPGTFLVQDAVPGRQEVVQSIFRKAELITFCSYSQQIEGVGGSASGRISIHRPAVVAALRCLGESLAWHGADARLLLRRLSPVSTGLTAARRNRSFASLGSLRASNTFLHFMRHIYPEALFVELLVKVGGGDGRRRGVAVRRARSDSGEYEDLSAT